MHSYQQFKIQQLRLDQIFLSIETIVVFILAIMTTVFLPSIMYTYVFANQQLTEEPAVMKYIPIAAFGVGVLFFAYATLRIMSKMKMVVKLEKEMTVTTMMDNNADMMEDMDKTVVSRKTVAKKTNRKPAKK